MGGPKRRPATRLLSEKPLQPHALITCHALRSFNLLSSHTLIMCPDGRLSSDTTSPTPRAYTLIRFVARGSVHKGMGTEQRRL